MNPRTILAAAFFAAAAFAAPAAFAQAPTVRGQVLETQDIEGYTYMRLKTAEGETWAAVPTAKVKKGAQVTLENVMVMQNFESRALKRKFDRILFASLAGGGAQAPAAETGHPKSAPATPAAPVGKIAKATGPNAKTVAEVVSGGKALKDKPVTVRGKVVKVNSGIRGRNWLHLQDGSGDAGKGTNDLTVTTTQMAAVGDVVSASGTVRTGVVVGPGYEFPVLVEDAKLSK